LPECDPDQTNQTTQFDDKWHTHRQNMLFCVTQKLQDSQINGHQRDIPRRTDTTAKSRRICDENEAGNRALYEPHVVAHMGIAKSVAVAGSGTK
jgi:hypothetical protein